MLRVFIIGIVALCCTSCFVSGQITSQKVWMDGLKNDDVQINCPSLRFLDSTQHFAPPKQRTSTVRCGACTLIVQFIIRRASLLVHRQGKGKPLSPSLILEGTSERLSVDENNNNNINNHGRGPTEQQRATADDLAGALCEALHDVYTLRQQPDGKRVWARRSSAPAAEGSQEEKEALSQLHFVPSSGVDPTEEELLPLKFHTPEERKMLPCARHLLRDLCYREITASESAEEEMESCVAKAGAVLKKQHDNSANKKTQKGTDGDAEGPQGRRRRRKEQDKETAEWAAPLEKCLERVLSCSSKWCRSPMLTEAQEREFLHFAWYEGAFGNQKFSYVADRDKRGRNKLNPYRKSGELAGENPWLNGTWRQIVEDL